MISLFNSRHNLFVLLLVIICGFNPSNSQHRGFAETQTIYENGMIAYQTVPEVNPFEIESLKDHLSGVSAAADEKFVLGGAVLWWANDQGTAAIANTVSIDAYGDVDVTGWTLNSMRISKYSDENNIPHWVFPTVPIDPFIDVSTFGAVVAGAVGQNFYLFDTTGVQFYNLILPDSLYAVYTAVSRDGSMAVLLASQYGNSNTARIYAFDISFGSTTVAWTYDVSAGEIGNWAGVNFSASGEKVAVTGRYHLYVFNSSSGSLIWDRFLDNTESPPAISGDGDVVVTADNSGFIQTWHFNSTSSEYDLLWQYRIPPGTYTNWASSVGISADGNTILAGSLIFLASGYDGSVMCFDTYGNGLPKWIYSGVGDLVDDIKVSDDGRVAAAVTWGDYPAHLKPDLLVFDVETGQVTFDVVTPGSFFTCDITPDGNRVFAGGKAVHAREFGNGGRIYLCEIELGGGHVSGNVDLTNSGDDSGVLVSAVGTTRSAVTDVNGNYLIENIPAGTYSIKAEKPGYNFGEVTNVVVTEGNTTAGVNFSLTPFSTQPPALSASSGLVGVIMLSWNSLFQSPEREREIALMVGDLTTHPPYSLTKSVLYSENNLNQNFLTANRLSLLADSVAVYRSLVSGGPYMRIGTVPAAQNSFADSNVFALRDYFYVISIINETGQSVYSNEAIGQVSDTLLTFSLEVPESSVPTVDGVLSAGEWDDAFKLDISDIFGYGGGIPQPQGSVFMYFKFDDNTDMLYIAGEDFLNLTLDDNEGFGLYFDDNNNNIFDGLPPFIREGNFWAYWHPTGSNLRFREIPTYIVDTLENALVEFSDVNGHLQGEVAIPMGFLEGYQLQVFAPDKIAGLGAFIIARQGGAAIFNGWWPQTMNTVFNPEYFGDVGIDVSLIAPPKAPSDISVSREGEDLLITWVDPVLGLNNEPLPVPAEINLYKNGEFLTTLNAGIESYLDQDVYCVAWYEYQLEAVIQADTLTLTGPISPPIGEYACQEPVLIPISYDDGEWDAFYVASFSWENNKFGIRFTPASYPVFVRKLQTIVNGNDPFNFTVQADNGGIPGDTLAGPYLVYDSNPATVGTIIKNLPGTDPPEIIQGDFWVVINWLEQTPGAPGIGVDIDPPIDNRSMYYLTSSGWTSIGNLDIMVTTYVTDQPVGVSGEEKVIPLTFELDQNFPNPFNPSTKIRYQIPQSEMVTLEIYNVLGEKVRTLINEVQSAGKYEITWDGKNDSGSSLSSGVYLYRITAGSFVKVMKMMLIR